jgi:hypothetical protein
MIKTETDDNGVIHINADECIVKMSRDGHRIYFQFSTANGGFNAHVREETAEAIRDAFNQILQ